VSALPYVIGSKQDGNSCSIQMNSDHKVELIAIDNDLKKIAVANLVINVVEQCYVSVLTKREDGTYGYESVRKENVVHSEDASIPADGLKYALPTSTPGNYFLEVREKDSDTRVCKVEFHVSGLGKVSRSLDKNAELVVKLDREQYNAGDEIEVSITAPYTGSGLITIERDKVYAHQWFESGQTSSVQKIKLPPGFDGTGYVNVSFIRALDSKEIFMSPLSYGVVPFTANREKRRIKLDLRTVKLSKPGEPLKIGYKTDRPAKIVVFAVDAGILQVTGYELPNPLEYYFRKQALMVKTSQIVDLILPEFSILRSSAFGGGEGEISRHLNPFKRVTEKPVVFWSGVIDADATEREVVYDVPDYFNGTLTVMAVAVSPDAVGSAQSDPLIRGPFVLTPGVPTLVAPGDQFEVGVTVANNAEGSGSNAAVTLTAESSEHLTIVKSPEQPLVIPEGREISATFTVRANAKLGSASLLFKASGSGQSAKLRSTLSVRPAVPMMTQVNSGNFTRTEREVPVDRVMVPEYRSLEAVVSALPLGLARGLDVYLKNYPNGCSEQITSGAFCRLMISDEADFGLTRAEIFAQLERTYDVLRSRQNDQGTFGYWAPESNDGIDFISTYVMHFLIEAKAAGFAPPADVYQSGLRNLQKMVVKDPHNLSEARTLAYAIYLLTREEVITTNYILNLRDYLDKNYPKQWQGDLTGVYLAGSWSMLKNDREAQKLINAYRMGHWEPRWRCDFYQPLGADSQYLAMIARHFPDLLKRVTASDFQAISGPIGRGDFNTLSAAYSVMALKSYSQHLAMNPPELSITEIAKDKHQTDLSSPGKLIKRVDFSGNAVALRFGAKPQISGPGAYFQMIETGFDSKLPEKKITDGIEVYREIVDASGSAVAVAHLGEPLTVHLKIRSLNRSTVTNVAIVDLLPGGFEIVGSSLHPGTGVQGCDYVEVREDRAVFFTSLWQNVRTITYQIKPCNRGEFVVPPVFAESMYDRSIKSRG
ncbi:MAG: alpha-2-macroglobulin family protein, partial [Verrucomicrobiota bacterium]